MVEVLIDSKNVLVTGHGFVTPETLQAKYF
jgi:hypothetical protein